MIVIEKLSEQKGASRFGSCNSCGVVSSDNDTLIRIKTVLLEGNSSSICLCSDCVEQFMEELKNRDILNV